MPAPTTLWHYTSAEGIYGILTTGSVWATDIRYLNDASEFRYAVSLILQLLEPLESKDRDEGSPRSALWKRFREFLRSGLESRTYVFSLSRIRDDLSQWRGYTPQGNGYSIGFNGPSLMPSLEKNSFLVAPCTYDSDEQIQLLSAIVFEVGEMIDAWLSDGPEMTPHVADHFATMLYSVFVILAPLMKHPAFSREEEWRLIGLTIEPTDENVDLRVGRSTLVPYFRLVIGEGNPHIDEVVVGPTSHSDLALLAVRKLIVRSKIGVGRLGQSLVPFRLL